MAALASLANMNPNEIVGALNAAAGVMNAYTGVAQATTGALGATTGAVQAAQGLGGAPFMMQAGFNPMTLMTKVMSNPGLNRALSDYYSSKGQNITGLISIYESLDPTEKEGIANMMKMYMPAAAGMQFGMMESAKPTGKNLIKQKYTRKQLIKIIKRKYPDYENLEDTSHDDLAWIVYISNL